MDDGIIFIDRKRKTARLSFSTFEELEKIADEKNTLTLMIVDILEDEEEE